MAGRQFWFLGGSEQRVGGAGNLPDGCLSDRGRFKHCLHYSPHASSGSYGTVKFVILQSIVDISRIFMTTMGSDCWLNIMI